MIDSTEARAIHNTGIRLGRAACEQTHDDLAGSCFDSGWEDGYEEGQARGRVTGALIVAVLVGLACALARRWGR